MMYNKVLKKLFYGNFIIFGDKKISRESRAVLEISYFSGDFLISIEKNKILSDLDFSKYGDKNNKQMTEECYYYYDSIFKSGKFDKSLNMLKKNYSTKKAIIVLSEHPKPKNGEVPCMVSLTPRIINGKLNLSCHMRANNAYRILLMNIFINLAIQREFAKKLEIPCGKYYHFVDSLHIYKKDLKKIDNYLKN